MSNGTQFLLFTQDQQTSSRLTALLATHGRLTCLDLLHGTQETLSELGSPRLIFIDFNSGPGGEQERLASARLLCTRMVKHFPQVPRVALTRYEAGALTVEAMRAGASDCMDLDNESDAQRTLMRWMDAPGLRRASDTPLGRSILVMGARQGMGSTTLATHLAELGHIYLREAFPERRRKASQEAYRQSERHETRTCLLDLGIPTRDGLLYLDVPEGFHFVDAVHSLHRLDDTLLDSALPHDPHGLRVLSFPPRPEDMRSVTHADALALFNRLRDSFGLMIVDLGGMDNTPFIASLANAADQTWILTDPSLGGLLSLAECLERLHTHNVEPQRLQLVINRYDSRYGLSAQQIADKFELPLLGTLPDCTLSLWRHLNQGDRLARTSPRHPYVQAARQLLEQALTDKTREEPASGRRSLWSVLKTPWRAN